jgi:hypothetical protein
MGFESEKWEIGKELVFDDLPLALTAFSYPTVVATSRCRAVPWAAGALPRRALGSLPFFKTFFSVSKK